MLRNYCISGHSLLLQFVGDPVELVLAVLLHGQLLPEQLQLGLLFLGSMLHMISTLKKFLKTHPPITKAIRFFTLYLHNNFN
jgi:hypothetical protein